jgi:hypothetical protein
VPLFWEGLSLIIFGCLRDSSYYAYQDGREKSFMAVKLNMSKAYNHVEWRFLEETTKRMGFAPWWTQLIMMCVTMVQYAVAACKHIQPARGIRQGDPISSYMFLICAKILSSMLSQANQGGALTGVPILKKGPRISLFFFFFFCR